MVCGGLIGWPGLYSSDVPERRPATRTDRDATLMDGQEAGQKPHDPWSAGSWPREVVLGRSIWHPAAGYGRLIGLTFIGCLALIALLSMLLLIQDRGAVRVIWGVVFAGAASAIAGVTYLLRGLATIRYVLGDDHLRIEWRRMVRRIPYDDMLQVTYHLRDAVELPDREPYWPGYRVSTIRTRDGVWHSYATVPPHRRVRITTPVATFAISPERPVLFIQELERRRLGTPLTVAPGVRVAASEVPDLKPARPRQAGVAARVSAPVRESLDIFRREILTDGIASTLVAIGVIIPVFILAYTFNEVDFLPEQIPLQWSAQGEPVRVGSSATIWALPLLALTVLVVNAALATFVIQFDRVAARLLVSITPVVQILVAIAIWRIIN